MPFNIVLLWTDILLFGLTALGVGLFFVIRAHEHLTAPWRQVGRRRLGMAALVILLAFLVIGLLDSMHFRVQQTVNGSGKVYYSTNVTSVLDTLLAPLGQVSEKSYSAPLAITAYSKSFFKNEQGKRVRGYPRLKHAGQYLTDATQRRADLQLKILIGVLQALLIWVLMVGVLAYFLKARQQVTWEKSVKLLFSRRQGIAWLEINLTLGVLLLLACVSHQLASSYHLLGTDKVGQDIFYESVKSIRTGLVIGTITTLVMLPFALFMGTVAGYFRGWVDDVIQYIYTTLSSIPGVLLISAAVLSLQVYISTHADQFPTLAERADLRLLALCLILGVTSWTSLCRLLRAETLKVREMDYVRASLSLGVSQVKILSRHILPNIMHIVLITVVLDFSSLVLAEAVLSYVGVGVDPTTISWGNMINSARLDLARDPVVWWPLCSAFVFMFMLVLSANLFSDAVRDAFDPRLRHQQ